MPECIKISSGVSFWEPAAMNLFRIHCIAVCMMGPLPWLPTLGSYDSLAGLGRASCAHFTVYSCGWCKWTKSNQHQSNPRYVSQGFIQWGGGAKLGAPPPPPLPPKKKERKKKRERRERERGGGEGEHVYFCVAVQVISIVPYFMTQLFKSTR